MRTRAATRHVSSHRCTHRSASFVSGPPLPGSGLPRANAYRPAAPRRKTSFRQFSPVASSVELDATFCRQLSTGVDPVFSDMCSLRCCRARYLRRVLPDTLLVVGTVSTRAGFRAICHEPTKNPGTGTGIAPVWRPATCRSAEFDSRHTGFFVIAAPCIWFDLGSRLPLVFASPDQSSTSPGSFAFSFRLHLPYIRTASTFAPSLCSGLVFGRAQAASTALVPSRLRVSTCPGFGSIGSSLTSAPP